MLNSRPWLGAAFRLIQSIADVIFKQSAPYHHFLLKAQRRLRKYKNRARHQGNAPRSFFVPQGANEDMPSFNMWPLPTRPNEMLTEMSLRALREQVQRHPMRIFRWSVSPYATPSGAFKEGRTATAALGEQLAIHGIHKSEAGKGSCKARKR